MTNTGKIITAFIFFWKASPYILEEAILGAVSRATPPPQIS